MTDGQIAEIGEPDEAELAPEAAEPVGRRDQRPLIQLAGAQLHWQTEKVERWLMDAGVPLYERASSIVRPVRERVTSSDGSVTETVALHEVDKIYLRYRMSKHIRWESYSITRGAWEPAKAPLDMSETILSRKGEWPFHPIGGVISTPTLRPDGTILSAPGYDKATALYVANPVRLPPIPDRPSREQGLAALRLLKDLLVEFPFVNNASRSVALSALMTPVMRGAMDVVPAHFVRAPTQGTGKTYVFTIVAAIALGHPCPVMAAGRTEEETEKRLGAKALRGHPIICVDNVNGDLGGDNLCQLISQPLCEIRVLGASQMPLVVNRFNIFGTGNNLRLIGDMARRSLLCDLDAGVERPAEREFKAKPHEIVLADRGRYIAACLTVVRAYLAAGSPKQLGKAMNGFGNWSCRVRSALIWLGEADPVDTLETVHDEDPQQQALAQFIDALKEMKGTGKQSAIFVRELLLKAQQDTASGAPAWPALRDSMQGVAQRGIVDANAFGLWLRQVKGRFVDGHRLSSFKDRHSKTQKWFIETTDQVREAKAKFAGGAGSCGVDSDSS